MRWTNVAARDLTRIVAEGRAAGALQHGQHRRDDPHGHQDRAESQRMAVIPVPTSAPGTPGNAAARGQRGDSYFRAAAVMST
jgi:hypothetical protein